MITDPHLQPAMACPVIFLADDDSDDCAVFTDALNEIVTETKLSCAPSCEKLLELLKTANPLPNLIFLDINIPVMGGLSCLRQVKNHHRYAAIPVIMYSTSYHPADVTTAYNSGATRYFCKSSSFAHLKSSLHDILDNYTKGTLKASSNDFLIAEKKTTPSWPN